MKYNYSILTVLLAIIILYFSLLPRIPEEETVPHLDKLIHFFSYFLLSYLCYKSTDKMKLSIFLAGTYGVIIEIMQLRVPSRSFDIFDIVINYAGASFPLVVGTIGKGRNF